MNKKLTEEQKAEMRKINSERYNNDLEYKEYQRKKSLIYSHAIKELVKRHKKEFERIKLRVSKDI